MFKQQGKTALPYAAGLVLYNLLLIGVYPSIADSRSLSQISLRLPEAVRRVFGVASGAELDNFAAFVSSQCFGRIWLLVMGMYALDTADSLITGLIDQGVMAHLLSAPVDRQEVLETQGAVLLSGLAVLIVLTEAGIWTQMGMLKIPLNIGSHLQLSVLEFVLFITVGSYSLLLAALFTGKDCAGFCAASLTFIFYGLDVIAGLEKRFSWLRNLTIFGLVRPQEVLEGEVPLVPTLVLTGCSALFLALAGYIFTRKDLYI